MLIVDNMQPVEASVSSGTFLLNVTAYVFQALTECGGVLTAL